MNIYTILSFTVFMILTTATPGPAMIYALESGTKYRFYKVFLGAIAISSVASLFAIGAIVGLSAIMTNAAIVYKTLKIAGGCYLVYLGVIKFRAHKSKDVEQNVKREVGLKKYIIESIILGLSNPKALIFFAAVFPQFIPENVVFFDYVVLVLITFMTSLFCLSAYGLGGLKLSELIKKKAFNRVIDYVAGISFVGFGSILFLSKD